MAHEVDDLKPHEIWMLRIGLSYAFEALWLSLDGPVPLRFEAEIDTLRTSMRLLPSEHQPPCVLDRFAYYAQTIRLSREQTQQLRDAVFEKSEEV